MMTLLVSSKQDIRHFIMKEKELLKDQRSSHKLMFEKCNFKIFITTCLFRELNAMNSPLSPLK